MKFFAEYKSTILLLIATIIFGYILGLAISTVVDYRLRDAVINLPKPKNNIILNIDENSHKLVAKEKFVDYDSDLEESFKTVKKKKTKKIEKKEKKSKKAEEIEKKSKKPGETEKKSKKTGETEKKKLKVKSKTKTPKTRKTPKNKKIKNDKREEFENYDAVEMGNNYSQINNDFKLKPNGKLFVNLTQKDSNLNKYSRLYNSNKNPPKVNFLEAANQEDTDQNYESIFKN